MKNMYFFDELLDLDTIDYCEKIENDMSNIELVNLKEDLKILVNNLEIDSKKELRNMNLDAFKHTIHCLIQKRKNMLCDVLYKIKYTTKLERVSLEIISNTLREIDYTNELLAKIYLCSISLKYIQNSNIEGYKNILKKDSLAMKGINYIPSKQIDIDDSVSKMERVYGYVKELKK